MSLLMSPLLMGWLCLAGSAAIEGVGQVAFKQAALNTARLGMFAGLHSIRRSPGWIAFGVTCFILEGLLFSVSLRLLDVSVAFPAGSLTFVALAIMSRFWLKEAVGARRWVGIALIIAGTALLGAS